MPSLNKNSYTCGAVAIIVFLLFGCGTNTKVEKVESVKDSSYTSTPKQISIILDKEVDFNEGLKSNIILYIRNCGADSQIFSFNNYVNSEFYKNSDSTLKVKMLSHDTETRSSVGYLSSFISSAKYEFTLVDASTQKNVWRSRMEFDQPDPRDNINNQLRGEQNPDVVWASALIQEMKKDGILKSCRP